MQETRMGALGRRPPPPAGVPAIQRFDGRFWIRRGRSTVAPSPSELQELFNAFGLVLTEQQIDFDGHRTRDIDLERLSLIHAGAGYADGG